MHLCQCLRLLLSSFSLPICTHRQLTPFRWGSCVPRAEGNKKNKHTQFWRTPDFGLQPLTVRCFCVFTIPIWYTLSLSSHSQLTEQFSITFRTSPMFLPYLCVTFSEWADLVT
jgi:hypothetical protein